MTYTDKVIEVLNERGWIQGDMETEHGVCMMGAHGVAMLQHGSAGNWEKRCERVMGKLFPERGLINECTCGCGGYTSIPDFNDHKDTTLEDVMLVLKHVAAEEES